MSLAGNTILVTGASGGIGQLISINLAASKAHILLVGRAEGALAETRSAIIQSGGHADILVADLLVPQDRQRVVDVCSRLNNGLHGLINNAGCNHFALLADQTDVMIEQQIRGIGLHNMLLGHQITNALRLFSGCAQTAHPAKHKKKTKLLWLLVVRE